MHGTNTHTQINRRTLLTAAPLAALSSALLAGDVNAAVAQVLAESDTPALRAYRAWAAYQDWLDGPDTDDLVGAELNEAYKEGDVLRDQTLALPCQGPADMVAKMLAATFNGQSSLLDVAPGQGLLAEARALVGGVA